MHEIDEIVQRVDRLFMSYSSPKDLSLLSDEKIRELVDYSVKQLYSWRFDRARLILRAIGAPSAQYRSTVLGDYNFDEIYDTITNISNERKAAKEAANPLEQNVESLFQNYSSPEDLSQLSDYKLRGLSKYSVEELYGEDFSKAQEILEEIGSMALPSLFNSLGNDRFNRKYDTIINIAKKHNAGDDVAKQVSGKLYDYAVRSKGLNLMIETGGSPHYLIYAWGNNSVNGYAEEMLRALHKDERYTDLVKQELEKAQNPNYFYKGLSRERAKVILNTL